MANQKQWASSFKKSTLNLLLHYGFKQEENSYRTLLTYNRLVLELEASSTKFRVITYVKEFYTAQKVATTTLTTVRDTVTLKNQIAGEAPQEQKIFSSNKSIKSEELSEYTDSITRDTLLGVLEGNSNENIVYRFIKGHYTDSDVLNSITPFIEQYFLKQGAVLTGNNRRYIGSIDLNDNQGNDFLQTLLEDKDKNLFGIIIKENSIVKPQSNFIYYTINSGVLHAYNSVSGIKYEELNIDSKNLGQDEMIEVSEELASVVVNFILTGK